MSQTKSFDAIASDWSVAMDQSRFEDALSLACAALELSIRERDPVLQKAASLFVSEAIAKNSGELYSQEDTHCSFCARTRMQARLVVGAEGKICEYCATNAYRFFTEGRMTDDA